MVHSPSESSSSSAPLLAFRSRSPLSDDSPDVDADVDAHALELKRRPSADSSAAFLDLEASLARSNAAQIRSQPPPYTEKTLRHVRHTLVFARHPRVLAIAAILLFLVAFSTLAILYVANGSETQAGRVAESAPLESDKVTEESMYPASVLGAPTESFRDNLHNDTQYITSWINAGWTNDFMTYVNLLYLALLSSRTAILPPFAPSHVGSTAGYIAFGDVFDVPRLARLLDHPVIEWRDVKREDSAHTDALGCWSIWATAAPAGSGRVPRGNAIEPKLGLDVSYTPVPEATIMFPQFDNDPHTRFAPIAALTFPGGREAAHLPANAPFPGRVSGHTALPDEHMACFDFPYYLASVYTFEFNYDFSPAWRFVGTHAHWTSQIEGIATSLVRQTFNLSASEALPPFISIHVRHGDFGNYCSNDACFAPLSAFAVRVEEVKRELRERKGVEVERVLMTSDERDAGWWASIREMGWEWVDHGELKTEETYGRWYPVLLDAVVQSLGVGFVGTDRSTMSLIAQRRVEDWRGGVTREVKWGSAGADDHKRKRAFADGAEARAYEFAI
ncbi:hypothetical protein EW145_g7012 [Phellinidium pouzarii]|uniref:Uncharacterized protein n=1 Tax=Phellinidium pouzarii TaxID=167371 RepID=A0A4S4KSE5_9AGAM|nr:hypothetical protein EW145_g7012 [Phellinidium pouzarii]